METLWSESRDFGNSANHSHTREKRERETRVRGRKIIILKIIYSMSIVEFQNGATSTLIWQ